MRPFAGRIDAVVTDVPGSKSIANRALACAALADGTSTLRRLASGDDTMAMLDCLEVLGAGVRLDADAAVVTIVGVDGVIAEGPATLSTRLAGTTSRFVTALASLGRGPYTIDGAPPLRSRPMSPLHDALRILGAVVTPAERWGHLPVDVGGGDLHGGVVVMPGDISSQYITALMLIAPYLADGLTIELSTELVSRPYISLTAQVMASFGVTGVTIGDRRVTVAPGRYKARDYSIEVDASSASYAFAAAAIAGGTIVVEGLGSHSYQGDAGFATVLESMGAEVTTTSSDTTLVVDGALHGITIDMADVSDTVPSLAVVAAFADGPTTISGVEFIRRKETDRIAALVTELRRCGADVDEHDDGLTIRPVALHGAAIDTYHDHRIAMSMALVGLRVEGIVINDPAVVSKSWPNYWSFLTALQPD